MFSQAMGTGWAPSNSGYSDADEVVSEAAAFLPNAVPQDYEARARFLTYKRDEAVPHHRFNWNFLVNLPFGKGKPLLGTNSIPALGHPTALSEGAFGTRYAN